MRLFIAYRTLCLSRSSNCDKHRKQQISWFAVDNHPGVNVCDIPREGDSYLKCPACKCNNWTDNGRSINEYECDSCGQFITTSPIN